METEPLSRRRRAMLALLLVAGAALRVWQFAGGAAFWTDEISFAENVAGRPLSRLVFAPLDFDQVAPAGFLLLEKCAALALGSGERALRLFPLLFSLAALLLFARLATRVLARWTAAFAIGLFALGVPLVRYAAETKQYSGDVAAAILLTLLALDLARADASARRRVLAGLVGFVLVWFSQPAVFVLAGLAAGLLYLSRRGREGASRPFPAETVALWLAGGVGATLAALRTLTPAMRAELYRFWGHAFWPAPRTLADALWLPRTLRGFWGQSLFQYPGAVAYAAIALVGFGALWRRRRDAAVLLLAPVAVALAASAFRLYPFFGRLLLPFSPAFLVGLAEGGGCLAARLRVAPALAATVLAIGPVAALATHLPVQEHEEIRPLLAWVGAERRPGDAIYISYGAERAVRWYGPRFGLSPDVLTFGGCHRDDRRKYLSEVDAFRGRPRVFVVFAHDVTSVGEQAAVFGYLDRIGRLRARREIVEETGSPMVAALYDLSRPEGLASASAASFSLPPGDAALAARLGCGTGRVTPAP